MSGLADLSRERVVGSDEVFGVDAERVEDHSSVRSRTRSRVVSTDQSSRGSRSLDLNALPSCLGRELRDDAGSRQAEVDDWEAARRVVPAAKPPRAFATSRSRTLVPGSGSRRCPASVGATPVRRVGSNVAMSRGHALGQRQQQIDDALVLTRRDEIERLLVG